MSTPFSQWWSALQTGQQTMPFVLIDCAGLPGGASELPRATFSELESLFTGELASELADVSGYLGQLKALDANTEKLLQQWFAKGLAMVLELAPHAPGQAALGFAELRRHLRKFNVIYGPNGKPMYWRYYDPRTLPDTLRVLQPDQLQAFFGPVRSFSLQGADGQVMQMRCSAAGTLTA